MPTYVKADMVADTEHVARLLHLFLREAQQVQYRWFNGGSTGIPNDSTLVGQGHTGAAVTNMITRIGELITDYTASSNAKLNTVLAMSDLVLPGDTVT